MLNVKTPDEVLSMLAGRFGPLGRAPERVALSDALGRVLCRDVMPDEYVPGFDRSTVDGYAVRASDVFGCSAAIPAILTLAYDIPMGGAAARPLLPGECAGIPTGGDLPEGADCVVMLEHTEDYGDGTIGILSPLAPGNNIIFKGDDARPGRAVLPAGTALRPHDIGALSAVGIGMVDVRAKPVVGIISTGDELIATEETPLHGQIRDVNSPLLDAAVREYGGDTRLYGIISDDLDKLTGAMLRAVSECDIVLISGGSSAGERDLTAGIIGGHGELILHGIAMKPGKPTIFGLIDGKPVFGLPGHPVAAYFTSRLFVRPLIYAMLGCAAESVTIPARITEAISSNHGRAEFLSVRLQRDGDGYAATPIRSKSGLIACLAGSDGYISVARDSEGLPKGASVDVTLWNS